MKVFVVTDTDSYSEDWNVLGVFDSLEKAEKLKQEKEAIIKQSNPHMFHRYVGIEEWDVE